MSWHEPFVVAVLLNLIAFRAAFLSYLVSRNRTPPFMARRYWIESKVWLCISLLLFCYPLWVFWWGPP